MVSLLLSNLKERIDKNITLKDLYFDKYKSVWTIEKILIPFVALSEIYFFYIVITNFFK